MTFANEYKVISESDPIALQDEIAKLAARGWRVSHFDTCYTDGKIWYSVIMYTPDLRGR